jgi:hypothetical protein
MITAKNYAAQAEKDLRVNFKTMCLKKDFERVTKIFTDEIKNAVHFALPDNGVIFDDEKKGIRGERIRLPFPKITVEYYCPDIEEREKQSGLVWASKRLILSEELTTKQLVKNIQSSLEDKEYSDIAENIRCFEDDDMWIAIHAAAYYPHVNLWTPEAVGWILPSAWDEPFMKKLQSITDRDADYSGKAVAMHGFPVVLCPEMIELGTKIDGEDVYKNAMKDIASEVSALLELCEALSCSNVHHQVIETINPTVNQRRIRDGKVPIYETRTLWIDVPGGSKDSGDGQGGTHRSPRQHLRRGHIRNLQSGKKVWVNAAVVGAKENGMIKKDYAIKELA